MGETAIEGPSSKALSDFKPEGVTCWEYGWLGRGFAGVLFKMGEGFLCFLLAVTSGQYSHPSTYD
ncbi:hypothetical protein A2U01_0017075 [Trifolium medium]|uniref:Uncharacterized protein n=1 Tax=Trifolium medium TaxID=97028 RepID=A0A392N8Y8_9FABA|nr:hypothetical protein [Trifolium medium]